MTLTEQYMDELLYAQQGELDAVAMYNALAKKVKSAKDAEAFKQLASEEGRHASVFHAYTKQVLKPKNTKAIAVPLMYKVIGRKRLYPIIAKQEYAAAKKYEKLVDKFEDVKSVQDDEVRHGDIVLGLLKD
ncbi:MAG: rubrerythrin [Oscillospiraceae bacterium]|nr:rubrerythrin [Oscillospiraceae bacterium]